MRWDYYQDLYGDEPEEKPTPKVIIKKPEDYSGLILLGLGLLGGYLLFSDDKSEEKEEKPLDNFDKAIANKIEFHNNPNIIVGGRGDNLTPKDVDPSEYKKGLKVEMEHTNNKDIASEIALDHLAEDDHYYTHLEGIHKENPTSLPEILINLDEEFFKEIYEENNGNYAAIAKSLNVNITSLINRLKKTSWGSSYPAMGRINNLTPDISEDDFKKLYEKHDGTYSYIALELNMTPSVLHSKIKRKPWGSKYPPLGSINLMLDNIPEKEFEFLYNKHKGNYERVASELNLHAHSLLKKIRSENWGFKYPPMGHENRKVVNVNESEFKILYDRHNGNYSLIASELDVRPDTLKYNVKSKSWGYKYPAKGRRGSNLEPRKKLNRGQFQDALAKIISGDLSIESDIKSEVDLITSDISDLYDEGMSVDEISSELGIEKAIINRVLTARSKKENPIKDPKGGLTAEGRKYFKDTEGANLKAGVTKVETLEDLKRWGQWARRFYGRSVLPPMKDEKGEPTRIALDAQAWGCKIPKNKKEAKVIARRGSEALKYYKELKKKGLKKNDSVRFKICE
jgi:hypothetical protein